jgi:prepilin-type N-terminal cleavage/methylation domain-containing protein
MICVTKLPTRVQLCYNQYVLHDSYVRSRKAGFTLVEVLVVCAIMAILMALVIPLFSGEQTKAHDSTYQQEEAVAYQAAKSYAVANSGNFDLGSTTCGTAGTLTANSVCSDVWNADPELSNIVSNANVGTGTGAGSVGVGQTTGSAGTPANTFFAVATDSAGYYVIYKVIGGVVLSCPAQKTSSTLTTSTTLCP